MSVWDVLPWVSVWWDVLPCVSVWWDVLPCVPVWWDVLPCVSVWWDVLPCVSVWWDVLQYHVCLCGGMCYHVLWDVLPCVSVWWNVLPCVSVWWNVLPCVVGCVTMCVCVVECVAMCVCVVECVAMCVFPYSMTKSLETFFQGRSAISILNWASFSVASGVSGQLDSLVPHHQSHTSSSSAPILHLKVCMSPGSFLAFQLLQSSLPTSMKTAEPSTEPSLPKKLSVIHAHKSLLTLYTSAVDTDVLVLSSSDATLPGEGTQPEGPWQGEGPQQREEPSQGKEPSSKVKTRSIKILAELKFPVVQANFSALVESEVAADHLPGLAPVQQQLDFSLVAPTTANSSAPPRMVVCDLLEAGVKDAGVSLAAHVVNSNTNHHPVLLWDHLEATASPHTPDCDSSANEATQHVYTSVSVPVLWCQLASPPCGLPDPAAGGLDILLLCDAVQAWKPPTLALRDSIMAVLSTKACRDRQVLLTLITNAVQSQPLLVDKPSSPVLAELSVQYRNTIVFSCLHHVWRALPLFSEIHVPPSSLCSAERSHSYNQLLALLLALASHLYTLRVVDRRGAEMVPAGTPLVASRPNSPITGRAADQGSMGYVSISPSPSDMAMPNRVYANRQYWEEEVAPFSCVDHSTLSVLREALLPLLLGVGVPVDHQLQMPQLSTARLVIDFSVELRDATLFVLDHMSSPSIPPSLSTMPTLLAEQLLIRGCIKHNSEMATALPKEKPSLLLPIPNPNEPAADTSKAGLLSNSCASIGTIHTTITAPLLKLTKHVSVTGRLRRKAWKQAQLDRVDATETPRPPSSAPPTVDTDPGEAVYVAKFASSLVTQLSDLHGMPVAGTASITEHQEMRQRSSSNIKVVEFQESPQPYRVLVTSASPSLRARADSSEKPITATAPSVHVQSSAYSSSELEHSQSVQVGEGTSPEDMASTVDTGDTTGTDSQHPVSSDNDNRLASPLSHSRPSTVNQDSLQVTPPATGVEYGGHTQSLLQGLSLPHSVSVFVLMKLNTVKVELQVETTRALLELSGISAAVDTRNATPDLAVNTGLPLLSDILPTYLSVAATLRRTSIRASDRGLPESDLIQLTLSPMYASVAISNCPPIVPSYRCLLKLTQLQVDIKQSVVKVHKRFQELMPAFTRIYHDIFGDAVEVIADTSVSASTSDQQVMRMESVIKLPVRLPQGFINISLDKAGVYVAPLPSLNVTYTVCKLHPLTCIRKIHLYD